MHNDRAASGDAAIVHQLRPGDDAPRFKRVVTLTFMAAFVAIQAGVPLAKLWAPRPARFGWQMFSATPQRSTYTLVMRNGTKRPVNLRLYVAHSRGEADLRAVLPAHLCRVVPDVAAVEITTADSLHRDVHPCR